MTVNKRKKNVRMRGSKTHGWGAKKKHRGSGNRGGKGRAGTGKRGDATKPSIWKDKRYFGRYGFKSLNKRVKCINLLDIELRLNKLLSTKNVVEKDGIFDVNLSELGYDKLLGKGKVTRRYNINVKEASPKAVDKVKKAGGNIVLRKAISKPETKE